jgi:hypothetical protein
MEGREFDRMTRSWARRTHRRRAVQGLVASVLAGWGWRRSATVGAQEDPGMVACSQDADCVDGDLDPCTGASCLDGACAYFIVDCIPGHVCCGNGACCPSGEPGSCLADADCILDGSDPCQGARCEGGTCVPFLVSCAPDFACCGAGECCPANGGCASDSDCATAETGAWARTRCVSGVCVPASTAA